MMFVVTNAQISLQVVNIVLFAEKECSLTMECARKNVLQGNSPIWTRFVYHAHLIALNALELMIDLVWDVRIAPRSWTVESAMKCVQLENPTKINIV